jgi:3'(2'),5'-bisphosphate nucleotidase
MHLVVSRIHQKLVCSLTKRLPGVTILVLHQKGREGRLASQSFQKELDVAIHLAQQAGDLIMGYYQTGVAVDRKAGDEPVTVADREADRLIAAGLRSAFPDDGLLTEESDDDLSRLDKKRVWIVDPLDGTSDFVGETGDFCVQIALAVDGKPALGVIYQPTTEQLLHAVHGRGAYQVQSGQTTRLRVSAESVSSQMCLVASRSHYSPLIEASRRALGIASVQHMGSVGLKVARVARGVCDLYLATTVAKEWDMCAPHALLLEAGGRLTNPCGEDISYNKPGTSTCRGLVGSNGLAHTQIVEAVAPFLDKG